VQHMSDGAVWHDEMRGAKVRRRERYSSPAKWAVARKIINGTGATEVERCLGIPESTALDWSYRYREDDEL
jgi:hypothetical protein